MKINTSKDVEALHQKIKDELGIDVEQYIDEEIIVRFSELLSFPQVILKRTGTLISISSVLFILSFFWLNLNGIDFLIHLTFGFTILKITSFFIGLAIFTFQIKSDILAVMKYSLNIMQMAIGDIGAVNDKISTKNGPYVLSFNLQRNHSYRYYPYFDSNHN